MEVKTISWYKVHGGSHENMELKCIAVDDTLVNCLSDFSWTYRWQWHDGLVALTPNVDRLMEQWWYDQWTEQPNPTQMWTESVMFKSDFLRIKFLQVFFPIFPPSLLTITSLFLSRLRRITYPYSIIHPSGNPSLCFNKPSDCETRSCLYGQVCHY